ncbi:MAG: type II toxin-antitoxin system Phd/YefM family antitoxin [bacterium]|nr:type II toxin-antitoxin system Phd/YefM family antitoxin [bacterium]MBU1918025.1 type II toxin-antitoxin system Phd/YefM family antitoxin [bacterium]
MEINVSALEMRKKFGSVLDRVHKKGDHVTITRGNVPIAVIIPAKEHEDLMKRKERFESVDEAFDRLATWQKENHQKLTKRKNKDSTKDIREMRDKR